jgi:hypothetical protein
MNSTSLAVTNERTLTIDDRFVGRILAPYFEHCRYLQGVQISFDPGERNGILPARLRAQGRFSIPRSSYIESTGHFNAAEFIMCFNQLGYVLLAQALQDGLVAGIEGWDPESFFERQLPDVLIVSARSEFRRMIDASDFAGEVIWTRASAKGKNLFGNFDVSFSDARGGYSRGETFCCMLGVVNKVARQPLTSVAAHVQ